MILWYNNNAYIFVIIDHLQSWVLSHWLVKKQKCYGYKRILLIIFLVDDISRLPGPISSFTNCRLCLKDSIAFYSICTFISINTKIQMYLVYDYLIILYNVGTYLPTFGNRLINCKRVSLSPWKILVFNILYTRGPLR